MKSGQGCEGAGAGGALVLGGSARAEVLEAELALKTWR